MNLVLGGERQERVSVSNHPDRDWTVEAGARLAEFLGVPLLSTVTARSERDKERDKAKIALHKARIARRHRRVLLAGVGAFLGVGGFIGFVLLTSNIDLVFKTGAWVFPISAFGGLALGLCFDALLNRRRTWDR